MRGGWRCGVLPGLVVALGGCCNLPLQQEATYRAPNDVVLPPLPAASAAAVPALVPPSRSEMEEQRTAAVLAEAQRRGFYDRQTLIGTAAAAPAVAASPLPAQARPGDCYMLVAAPPANGMQQVPAPAGLVWQQAACAAAAAAVPQLSRAQIRALQDALRERGYDPGPSDGIIGRRTRRALDAFQQAYQLPQQPPLNLPTLARLGLNV